VAIRSAVLPVLIRVGAIDGWQRRYAVVFFYHAIEANATVQTGDRPEDRIRSALRFG
jgi:hypothetical protein